MRIEQRPIGIFDSGVGGLSVWRALRQMLPHEALLYVADQAHVPYGNRPQREIAELTHRAVGWLWQQGAKLVVVACNTASAAALTSLRARWPEAAIVGMEPAVKPASEHTRSGRVGVLATPATLQAARFQRLVERYASGIEVHTLISPYLVEWVEAGRLDDPQIEAYLRRVLHDWQVLKIDQLVLGCTHYPFLQPVIERIMGPAVTVIDPAPAVARQVQRLLQARQSLAPEGTPAHAFATTGDAMHFRQQILHLLDLPQADVRTICLAPDPHALTNYDL